MSRAGSLRRAATGSIMTPSFPDLKQPDSGQRQQMIAAIKEMLRNSGETLDESRWLAPARGNWIDHDALFSRSEAARLRPAPADDRGDQGNAQELRRNTR